MNLFSGVPYPITRTPQGFLFSQSGVAQIKADLLILLLTNPGERVMEPTFGTPLRTLVFDPNDPSLQLKAKNMIINSIKQWEPRIAVKQITATSQPSQNVLNPHDPGLDSENILFIKIVFVDPQNIQEVQELTLELPLSQGT